MSFYGPPGTRVLKPYNLKHVKSKPTLDSWTSSTSTLKEFQIGAPNAAIPKVLVDDMEKYPCDEYRYSLLGTNFIIRRSGVYCYCAYVDLDCSEYQEITGWSEYAGWDYGHGSQATLLTYFMPPIFWKNQIPVTHDMVLEDVTKTIISVKNDAKPSNLEILP